MVMINEILVSVRNRLESALQNEQPRDHDWLTISNLVGSDGKAAENIDGKIVMTVASLQHDARTSAYQAPTSGAGDNYAIKAPPLFIDVYIAFVSCFVAATYLLGMALLSRIVGHFQEYPVLDRASAPDVGARMGRLAIEYVSLDLTQSSHFASLLGLKGAPFVIYRLRRLPFDGPAIDGMAPAVRQLPPAVRSGS